MPFDCDKKSDYSAYRVAGYPVKHKRKVPFSPVLKLDLRYREILKEIRDLDRELDRFVLSDKDYLDLVNESFASNIHWSTKIEGNILSMEQVRELTTKFTKGEMTETDNGPSQEILNHLYSFFITTRFKLPWSIETVMDTHRILMAGVNPSIEPGLIRDVKVSISDKDGFEFFIACPQKFVSEELQSLLDWLICSPYDEIVTSVLFFHEFESIHPFKDGNGRTGRTLFQILLQELGLKNSKLCKIEQEILTSTTTYYDLLAYTDHTADYNPLVMYITESLLFAYRNAVIQFKEKDLLKNMDDNNKHLVAFAKSVKEFTVNEACECIPSLGSQSVRARLNDLVDIGVLSKKGATKSMKFRFNDPLKNIREFAEGEIQL